MSAKSGRKQWRGATSSKAFTLVELLVVVAVIAILAGITFIAYGSWHTSILQKQVQNDLKQAAIAMDDAKNFGEGYPSTVPSSFTPSPGTVLSGGGSDDGTKFCINGTISGNPSIQYYITDGGGSPTSGTCPTAATQNTPSGVPSWAPSAVAISSTLPYTLTAHWSAPSDVTVSGYSLQCSTDQGFQVNVLTASASTTTAAISSGISSGQTYYCRVAALVSGNQGAWSSTISTSLAETCADIKDSDGNPEYGTYPTCYSYDSLPVGTSISGYWATPPPGYIWEDGSAISRTDYAALFSVIGTTYGSGDGSTTFNVPDSRGDVSVDLSSSDANFNSIGEEFGAETHTITLAELPSHNHEQVVTANSGGLGLRADWDHDGSGFASYTQGATTSATGGGGSYPIIQPSITARYAIKYAAPTGTASALQAGTSIEGYFSSVPSGYVREDGTCYDQAGTYAALYASIGTTYGSCTASDGGAGFNVPDARGRIGVEVSSGDSYFGSLGQKSGADTETLTIAQMPAHSHPQVITALTNGTAVRDDYNSDGSPGAYDQGVTTGNAGSGQAHSIVQPSITKLAVIKYSAGGGSPGGVSDAGIQPGTTVEGYWTSVPSGFLAENGQAVSRTTYASLFAVLGTTFGAGDGSTTFNLPDARTRTQVNVLAGDSYFGTLGQKSGAETYTLSVAQIPSHEHSEVVTANSGGTGIREDYNSDAAGGYYAQGYNTGSTGGGGSHPIIQPSIALQIAIKD